MTPEQKDEIRKIVRDELQEFLASDRYIFHKLVQFLDGRNIQVGRTTGTKIGTATDQKLAFYGGVSGIGPIIQRANANQASITTTGAVADGDGVYGYTTAAQANAIITLANEIRDALVALGLIKGSA